MAALSLVFDLIGRDVSASKAFKDVGDSAERAGKKGEESGSLISKGMKLAGGALLGAGLIEGFKSLYDQAQESAKIGRITTQVLQSTGGAAGVTAKQVSDLATAISNKTGVDDEAIQSGENLLLTFTGIRNEVGKGNDVFNQATAIVTDMSVALGQDMKSSAIQVGKALNDPIKGVTALQRVGVSFTASQKDQIKTLVETGNTMEAQKIILGELTKEFGGAAAAASTPFQKLQVQLGNLAEQVGSYLIPIVDDFSKFLSDHVLPNTTKLATFVGGVLNPALHLTGGALGGILDAGSGLVHFFESLPGPIQATATALGVMAAAKLTGLFSGLASLGETFALKMLYARDAVGALGGVMGGLKSAGAGLLNLFGGGLGLAITAIVASYGLMVSASKRVQVATVDITQAQQSFADALRESNGVINENVRQQAAKSAQDAGILDLAHKAGVALPLVTDALTGNRDAYKDVSAQLHDFADAQMLATGFMSAGTKAGRDQIDAAKASASQAQAQADAFDKLAGTTGKTAASQKQLADATKGTADATSAASAQTVEDAKAAQTALQDWLKQLQQIGASFVQPLSIYEDLLSEKKQKEQESAQATADATANSKDSWKDYVKDVSVSLDDYATKLEEQITNQDNWRVNIGKVAQRGGLEVAQILANMGQAGADLTAQMATTTDANFQRLAGDLIRNAANGSDGAAAAMKQGMDFMAEYGREGAKATAFGIADQLGIGAGTVADIAAKYGVNLATGINPLLTALGKPMVGYGGGRVAGQAVWNADGNLFENHSAQIAPGGAMRLWAEPETGGEAYIPLAPSKRDRSTDIWRQVGKRLGVTFQEFAFGGINDVPHPYSTAPYRMPISTAGDASMGAEYGAVTDWLKTSLYASIGGPGGGAERWRGLVLQVLSILGQPGSLVNGVLQLIAHESGGNPNAINLTDSNAAAGHPSQGLMQTIPGTFAAYAGPYSGLGITNPLANIYAGLNYGIHRYGSIANIPGIASLARGGSYRPYDSGGWLEPGYTLAYNGTGKPERVRTAEQETALTTGPSHVTLQLDGPAVTDLLEGRAVHAVTQYADASYHRGQYNG